MNASQALVSVVIPAFNAERTILEAIGSVLSQTYRNLEVVVCDDASTDDTVGRVLRIGDPRVELIRNAENLGPGASRDRAIESATGSLIAFVDADDAWHPDRITRLVKGLASDSNVMIFDDTVECHNTANGLVLWRRMRGRKAFGVQSDRAFDVDPARWLVSDRLLMHPLVSTAAIRNAKARHSKIKFGEDAEFFLRLLASGVRLRYLPEALYYYRLTPGSLTVNSARNEILREVVERSAAWFVDDRPMLLAIAEKAADLKRKARYQQLVKAMKAGELSMVVRYLSLDYRLGFDFVRHVLSDIGYHLHRLVHKGTGRVRQ